MYSDAVDVGSFGPAVALDPSNSESASIMNPGIKNPTPCMATSHNANRQAVVLRELPDTEQGMKPRVNRRRPQPHPKP